MDIRISKHFKGGKHVGFKKTIGGRNFHLTYGVHRPRRAGSAITESLRD